MLLSTTVVFGLLLLLWPRTMKSREANQMKAHTTLHLETFVVNLANADERAYLRVGIDLGTTGPVPEGKDEVARLRDAVLMQLAQQRSEDILSLEGKEKLKIEILKALQRQTPDLGVDEVYFTEFLVQR